MTDITFPIIEPGLSHKSLVNIIDNGGGRGLISITRNILYEIYRIEEPSHQGTFHIRDQVHVSHIGNIRGYLPESYNTIPFKENNEVITVFRYKEDVYQIIRMKFGRTMLYEMVEKDHLNVGLKLRFGNELDAMFEAWRQNQ